MGGAALALATALAGAAPAQDLAPGYWEFFGEIEGEGTLFFEDPAFPRQQRNDVSIAGKATLQAEWLDGDLVARLTPFARLDRADDRRSRWDIREAKLDYTLGDWSFRLGADTVFWGKTEVVHLVDIINQTDLAEDIDDEDRLGQPMLRVARLTDIGEFAFFWMPYQRERRFPGIEGRLRFDPVVNTARPVFETDAEEWTQSFAVRYAGVFGDVDLGLSAFHGLGRDPSFLPDGDQLLPVYQRITQGGIDVQVTSGATLWKAEGILRAGERNLRFEDEFFGAFTGGLEHTLYDLAGLGWDLGLIAEYAYDSRGDDALSAFENDLAAGLRLTLNDTQDTSALLTGALDLDDGSVLLRLEAERRLSPRWSASVESVGFVNTAPDNFARSFAQDSFVRLKLRYFF